MKSVLVVTIALVLVVTTGCGLIPFQGENPGGGNQPAPTVTAAQAPAKEAAKPAAPKATPDLSQAIEDIQKEKDATKKRLDEVGGKLGELQEGAKKLATKEQFDALSGAVDKLGKTVETLQKVLPTPTPSVARGADLFVKNCVVCHGQTRDKIPNANLANSSFLFQKGGDGLFNAIANGKGANPAFGKAVGESLDDTDIKSIVAYLSGGAPLAPVTTPTPTSSGSVMTGTVPVTPTATAPPAPTPMPKPTAAPPSGGTAFGPAGQAPQDAKSAASVLKVSDEDSVFLTALNPSPGDDTVIGWVLGTSESERLKKQVAAETIPAGACVDFDPNVTKVTGKVVQSQDFTSRWRRLLLAEPGSAVGRKMTIYWTPCEFK